jgi:hypothetical protein
LRRAGLLGGLGQFHRLRGLRGSSRLGRWSRFGRLRQRFRRRRRGLDTSFLGRCLGLRGVDEHAEMPPDPDGDILVDRAGMRLLLGDAELRQHCNNRAVRLLALPRQLVNSDFLHIYVQLTYPLGMGSIACQPFRHT